MAIVVPEKIYIGYNERDAGEGEKTKLGFATYLEDNKAFEKRKDTIDSWSKPYSEERIEEGDPDWEPDGHWYQRRRTERPDLEAEILDNPLQFGFKIARDVRRYGWGGGNVVWRIEDPRGFELEISSANMASIMDCTTIHRGEIAVPCRWGWNKTGGSRVVLLPENSEPYKEALKDTARHNASVSWKDVNIGDTVELKNNFVGTYLGYFHSVQTKWARGDERYHNQRVRVWEATKKKSHYFKSSEDGSLYMMASPKAAIISKKTETEMTLEDGAKVINELLRDHYKVSAPSYNNDVLFVSPKPIKVTDYHIVQQKITFEEFESYLKNDRAYNDPQRSKYDNVSFTFPGGDMFILNYYRQRSDIEIEQVNKGALVTDRRLESVMNREETPNRTWGCSHHWYRPNKLKATTDIVETAEINTIMMKFKDEFYPVTF